MKSQKVLLDLLSVSDPHPDKWDRVYFSAKVLTEIADLTAVELAQLFCDSAFMVPAVKFLKEEHWLLNKSNQAAFSFDKFIATIFQSELKPISFLESFFTGTSLDGAHLAGEKARCIEGHVIARIKTQSFTWQREFATHSLNLMSAAFDVESEMKILKTSQGHHPGLSLYRTFDRLDEVFNLNYEADHGMKTDMANSERLYEGAGVGVQSGYSTLLTALNYLNPAPGSRLIDLGSGYGRVGLVVGLMRPDIEFSGYEFVKHRVDIGNTTSESLQLSAHVRFYAQDLADPSFQIPDAEIFYLYDPFSEETYRHVLSQLVSISKRHKISIITKGNARDWLVDVARKQDWGHPIELDFGNLCIFRSR